MTMETTEATTRKVGVLLGIGIVILPIIFAWFTLRRGHSTQSRVISFIWLVLTLGGASQLPTGAPTTTNVSAPGVAAPAGRVDDRITMAKFSALETGMSYDEAVAVLGKPGTEISSSEIAGTRTVMYQWEAGFGANMNAMFQNDQLITKAQMGLR